MFDLLNHALHVLAHGLLSELPSQLLTTGVTAATAMGIRTWRRHHHSRAAIPQTDAPRRRGNEPSSDDPDDA
jgi:hypothetical protein